MRLVSPILLVLCLVPFTSQDAVADIVSNFGNEKNPLCKPFVVTDSALFAGSFNTDFSSSYGYKLDQIFLSIVSVSLNPAASNPGGRLQVQLWSDIAGGPGGVVQDLIGPHTPAEGLKPATLSYSSGFWMTPSTTYWVLARVTGGNDLSVGFELTNLKDQVSSPQGWSIGDSSFLLVEGVPVLDPSCVPYLRVDVFPVPEPGSIAILGLAGLGACLLRRRNVPG